MKRLSLQIILCSLLGATASSSFAILDFETGLGSHFIPSGITTNYGITTAAAKNGNFGFFGGDDQVDYHRPVSIYQNATANFLTQSYTIGSWFKNRDTLNAAYNESWLSLTPNAPFNVDPAGAQNIVEREGLIFGAANNQIYFQDHKDHLTASQVSIYSLTGGVTPNTWYYMSATVYQSAGNVLADLRINNNLVVTHNYGSASNFGWMSNARGGMMVDDYADDFSVTAVPEPTTLAVLGAGGLLLARRRNRAARR